MQRNLVKPKKGIILGVTLPPSAHGDSEVLEICAEFIKWLNITMLPLLPLLIPPFFMKTAGVPMTWFMTWLLALLIAPFAVFAAYRGKLMKLKRDRNWNSAASGRALADIKAAAIPAKRLSALWFLPPVIISLVPIFLEFFGEKNWAYLSVYISFSAMAVLFWILYHLIYRVRAEVYNEDTALTMALTRARRYNWGKFWIIASWVTGVFNVFMWVFSDNTPMFLVAILVYTAVIIIAAIQTEFAARAAQQRLTANKSGGLYLDEDDYWMFGILYYNPNDSHFLVNDRVGINMSVNLARPAAKILMAFALLTMLALPFVGIWMMAEENTPAKLVLSDTALTARHTRDQYVIELNTIESVELLQELPAMTRTAGTGFENLYKGNFSAGRSGSVRVCLQPKDPPFIMIKADGRTYIFSDADSNVTKAVFERIR
ncbi:MAG: PH domain-containing protein [Oscillospiraceae bacterium]|nr:PH domain-containing protein [Oscillospiraceae bacterium]